MVRRAVIVACNYPSKAYGLAGCVNDAFAIAEQLEAKGFTKENVVILHDVMPGRRRDPQKDETLRPTRLNILQRLNEMIRATQVGDVCFFSFSGYGMQVEHIEHSNEEGLDEAILPTDFQEDSIYNGPCVIECSELHDILASAPPGSSVTMLMDCDHATTCADVCGTLSGNLIGGIHRTHNMFCGVEGHAEKLEPSNHKREVWMEESARAVKARPRFQAAAQVMDPKFRGPVRPAMCRPNATLFCISAAAHGQTALELQVVTQEETWSAREEKKQHGLLSWCFVQAMKELRNNCNYLELTSAISRYMATFKRGMPQMDQEALLTFFRPRSDPNMLVLEPPTPQAQVSMPTAERQQQVPQQQVRPVVPPPPPGYVQSLGGSPPTSDLRPPSSTMSKKVASAPRSTRRKDSCCNLGPFSGLSPPKKPSTLAPAASSGETLWESIMSWFNLSPVTNVETSASPLKPRASPKLPAPRPDEPALTPQPPPMQVPTKIPTQVPVPLSAPVHAPVRWHMPQQPVTLLGRTHYQYQYQAKTAYRLG